jgi:hypothetical protein
VLRGRCLLTLSFLVFTGLFACGNAWSDRPQVLEEPAEPAGSFGHDSGGGNAGGADAYAGPTVSEASVDAGPGPSDAYAPLPPQPGDAGYNAIFSKGVVYVPLFSAPACVVIPPYGDSYVVHFEPPDAGPAGSFPACLPNAPTTLDCYQPGRLDFPGSFATERVNGGVYTLSPFDDAGVAVGQMDTTEGIVPLHVKDCP